MAARKQAAAVEACKQAAAEVIRYLRHLGCRADEARRAAARCETIPDAPLEDRVRVALKALVKPHTVRPAGILRAPA